MILLTVLITLTAVASYLNLRLLRLPGASGLLLTALIASMSVKLGAVLGLWDVAPLVTLLHQVDFRDTLLEGMLGVLLFAGALHQRWEELWPHRRAILQLAIPGTIVSMGLIALAAKSVATLAQIDLPWVWAGLFGALLAPTDPIAIGAVLKHAGIRPALRTTIAGESLFNDGLAVVAFLALLTFGLSPEESGVTAHGVLVSAETPVRIALSVSTLLVTEVVGGILWGLAIGGLYLWMCRSIQDAQTELLLSLAAVMGGFTVAHALGVSGVLAAVVLGLLVGAKADWGLSAPAQTRLRDFWELSDELLNALLFVLIGLEVLVIDLASTQLAWALVLLPLLLLARAGGAWVGVIGVREALGPGARRVLTWAGVRGGISIALALALPASPWKSTLLTWTYVAVVFSVVVQGLTMARLAHRWSPSAPGDALDGASDEGLTNGRRAR